MSDMPNPDQLSHVIAALDALFKCGVIMLLVGKTQENEDGIVMSFGTSMPPNVAIAALELWLHDQKEEFDA